MSSSQFVLAAACSGAEQDNFYRRNHFYFENKLRPELALIRKVQNLSLLQPISKPCSLNCAIAAATKTLVTSHRCRTGHVS
ncbi:hypothetical protein CMV_026825 [Castanea mollissima]|uniref:Uncharacterized protein n=1 Tax=Castanea mollissima TaxID=60419 RepID=A0A8J4V3E4_9ROSI|nr:hypothetical protein CMV_026825 [Castanea mollissima]